MLETLTTKELTEVLNSRRKFVERSLMEQRIIKLVTLSNPPKINSLLSIMSADIPNVLEETKSGIIFE